MELELSCMTSRSAQKLAGSLHRPSMDVNKHIKCILHAQPFCRKVYTYLGICTYVLPLWKYWTYLHPNAWQVQHRHNNMSAVHVGGKGTMQRQLQAEEIEPFGKFKRRSQTVRTPCCITPPDLDAGAALMFESISEACGQSPCPVDIHLITMHKLWREKYRPS